MANPTADPADLAPPRRPPAWWPAVPPATARWLLAAALLALATALRATLPAEVGLPFLTYVPALILAFHLCGRAPGWAVTAASLGLGWWLFSPAGALWRSAWGLALGTLAFVVTAGLTDLLMLRLQRAVHAGQQALAQLRQTEQRYLAMLQDQTELICRFRADGTVLFVNDAFCRRFGRRREDLVGHPWRPMALPDDLALIEARLAELRADNPVVVIENRVFDGQGLVFWGQFANRGFFDEAGRLLEVQAVGRDVTERKQLELQLAQTAADYRDLYDHSPCGYHALSPQGVYLHVNQTELDWLGVARDELVGRLSPTAFFTAESQAVFAEHFPALQRTGRLVNLPLELVGRHGLRRRVLLNASALYDAEGRFLMSRSVLLDITALSDEQARREQSERHARHLQQLLDERTEMLDVLAHEVRQPLHNASAALQGAARALLRSGDQATGQRVAQAQAVMGTVLASVDNTLTVAALLARTGAIERSDTDLDLLLALAIGDMAEADRPRVRIRRDSHSRTVPLDMSLMRLALRNLLANALGCSAPGTPVTVHLQDQEEPPALLIDVVDQGEGFAPEVQARLFQRGVRGPQQRQLPGHGLGLYIVERVMALHGGQVSLLHSGPQGSTMRLTINADDAA